MTTKKTSDLETRLRESPGPGAGPLLGRRRGAYYKAVEGLHTLAETLEVADIGVGETNDHALIEEHLIACTAIEAMNHSLLGRIL